VLPRFVVRVRVKNHANFGFAPFQILFYAEFAQLFPDAVVVGRLFCGWVFDSRVEINGGRPDKLETLVGLLVLLHHVVDVLVGQPRVWILFPLVGGIWGKRVC